jgi:hypothetical protein
MSRSKKLLGVSDNEQPIDLSAVHGSESHLPHEYESAIPPTSNISPSVEPLSIRAIPAPLRRTSVPGVTDVQVPLPEREREWVTPSEAQDEVIPPMTTREVPSLLSPRVAKA